ncbi:MAG: hypothetical protein JJ899_17500 [Alphaproteobacteria bacterium]|nr:hypothetical protein [Alphaproteobacteria bacterium]
MTDKAEKSTGRTVLSTVFAGIDIASGPSDDHSMVADGTAKPVNGDSSQATPEARVAPATHLKA